MPSSVDIVLSSVDIVSSVKRCVLMPRLPYSGEEESRRFGSSSSKSPELWRAEPFLLLRAGLFGCFERSLLRSSSELAASDTVPESKRADARRRADESSTSIAGTPNMCNSAL